MLVKLLYLGFVFFLILHETQLSRSSSSSSLSSNDSGTPIDIEGPIEDPKGLGFYNNSFQVFLLQCLSQYK